MDIERELETLINKHKGKQVGLSEIRLDWFAEDCLKEIRRLKATIARQTVTSAEVAEAIEWAQVMKILYTEKQMPECADCAKTAITALQQYQPWIPVSERLPERKEHYLCCEDDIMAIFVAYYSASGWQRPLYRDTTVTHWMPLPEPPKGGDGMKPNRCMDCPHRIANFMNRTCELTGNTIPLFSVPADCPLEEVATDD